MVIFENVLLHFLVIAQFKVWMSSCKMCFNAVLLIDCNSYNLVETSIHILSILAKSSNLSHTKNSRNTLQPLWGK